MVCSSEFDVVKANHSEVDLDKTNPPKPNDHVVVCLFKVTLILNEANHSKPDDFDKAYLDEVDPDEGRVSSRQTSRRSIQWRAFLRLTHQGLPY